MRRLHRTDKKTWTLLNANGDVEGTLIRTKWHGMGAEIAVAQGIYEARGMKGFTSDIAIYTGDVPVRKADFKWKGITITDPNGHQPAVTVRREHLFSSTYIIDAAERGQVKVRMRMNWKRFALEPEITATTGEAIEPLTVLFAIHAIRVQQNRAAAAAA